MKKFQLFLSGHMYILANDPDKDDILQLALLQPNDSEIYTQASSIIHGRKKKSWYKWRYWHTYLHMHMHTVQAVISPVVAS